ncbi:hypothetical protein ACWEPL_36405 [Nonomuraea sp. NPDC004186]|uniref:hypothetical protein n=1 Tax=Nonomuraea sp. NPDC049625 TaxID=3155775 RepID=UPI00343CE0C3
MAKARHLAALVAVFVVGGVTLAAGPSHASARTGPDLPVDLPVDLPTCLLPLPLLCDEQPEPEPEEPSPPPSAEPGPGESWPGPEESAQPWRPAAENEHRVPRGHPETGGGGLAPDDPMWPFALGGVALLTGAGLAGAAVRRRRGVA